jgi:hypothetical protein
MTEVEGVCDCALYEYWKCVENRDCYVHAANKLPQPHKRGGSNLRFALSRKYQTNHPPFIRKKPDMNDVRETGLVSSNSVLHMRSYHSLPPTCTLRLLVACALWLPY